MAWQELKLALGGLDDDRVEEALLVAGAPSVMLDDAGDEPPMSWAPYLLRAGEPDAPTGAQAR